MFGGYLQCSHESIMINIDEMKHIHNIKSDPEK
jgi:hypothetical protein